MKNSVEQDSITEQISQMFDYKFNGETFFDPPAFTMPDDFGIGLIVGPSGSGKSTILGKEEPIHWDRGKCIASHFRDGDDAIDRLSAVGLNSIPSWLREYSALSTGEKFRADLSRRLHSNSVVDEFTSVIDRTVAESCSIAVSRYIRQRGLRGVVFASCHYDVADWLQPDWVFDTRTGGFIDTEKKSANTFWRFCLAGSRRGQCSAVITICQETSTKVLAAGSPFTEGSQLGLPLQ